jgi:hypothetical protein
MKTPQQTILNALENYRGDNLYRARAAFRNCTPEQMQQQYGQSGQTRAEILAGYEAHDKEVTAAVEWLKSR